MCGRYTLTRDPADLEQRFGVSMPQAVRTGRYNIAPTEEILTLARSRESGSVEAQLTHWGLWGKPVINVRAESVLAKGGFRRLLESDGCRCLVLADGFYEWMKAEDRSRPRQPFRFTLPGEEPFAMAGLTSRGTSAILTCAPNPLVARLHDRMPVILGGREAEATWLDPGASAHEALATCVPLDAERMTCAPCSRRVNRVDPEDDGPHLLVPDAPESPEPERAPRLFA